MKGEGKLKQKGGSIKSYQKEMRKQASKDEGQMRVRRIGEWKWTVGREESSGIKKQKTVKNECLRKCWRGG